MEYYTVSQALVVFNRSITKRTLYEWLKKIETYTNWQFDKKINKDNLSFVGGRARKVMFLNEVDIQMLQKLYDEVRVKNVDLTKAIYELFLSPDELEALKEERWDYDRKQIIQT
ncbi:MAG: hypothetical protein LBV67_06605 [Streptococcaceae bacterium]|nr:hypothetical protein [Streptococcaceae bacterium]